MSAVITADVRRKLTSRPAHAFEELIPQIRHVATFEFRKVGYRRRQELLADVIAKAFVAYAELQAAGKANLIYPTVLARYAVRRIRQGRRVGERQRGRDVMSPLCQRRSGVKVFSLTTCPQRQSHWEDLVVQDRHATPADVAITRLDFQAWLRKLNRRMRAIAVHLACGAGTKNTARRFGVSSARISQVRGELRQSWEQFQRGCSSLATV